MNSYLKLFLSGLFVLTLFYLITPLAALAQGPISRNMEVVGQLGGVSNAVFVQGNYAYIGEGPRLTILDITNPVFPTVVGKTALLPGIVEDIYVVNIYAYVAIRSSGLWVINVSNPANPTEVGSYDTPGGALGVYIRGSYGYVASGEYGGLRVINISNPANLIEVGFYGTSGNIRDVYLSGNYAYVTDWLNGLRVINISNPTRPIEVGFYDTPGWAGGVFVNENYVYIADGGSGLRVVDVSNPVNPVETGFYDTPWFAENIYVSGNYAYIADSSSGLRVVDVSNPTNPAEIGFYDTPGAAYGAYVSGSYAYVADGGNGLIVVNVSNPANPVKIGSYDKPRYVPEAVYVNGSYAYIADWISGLRVVDVSNPANPTEIGFYNISGGAFGVYVSGVYAYIAAGVSGLRVVNVSNPANPIEVGSYDTPGFAEYIYISGNYAYVADGGSGLRVVDVSKPSNPIEVGSYHVPERAYDVYVSEGYAYITNGSGLRVVDVSNPVNPVEVDLYETPEYTSRVNISGNYAYIAAGFSGLRVVDVSNPTNPTEIGFYDTPGSAEWVYVDNQYAYVADSSGGLRVVNVSNPINPIEIGFYHTSGAPYGVYVNNGYIYVSDLDGGLVILKLASPSGVTLSGPVTGLVNNGYTFTATISPNTAITPITYTWQATGQLSMRHTGSVSDIVSFSWNTPGIKTITIVASNVGGTVTKTHAINLISATTGDAYEVDDTCDQASSLVTTGAAQIHTFHQQADTDWARFPVVANTTYVLQAIETHEQADLTLELYNGCESSPISSDDNAFSDDARLIFTAPTNEVYYVKARNHDPTNYGIELTYELSVRAQIGGGVALIIAGNNDNYTLQPNILAAANLAYQTFRNAGIPKNQIRYLSNFSDSRTDADMDGISDVFASSASVNVENAITSWAANLTNSQTPVYLYLVDHGGLDSFSTFGSNDTITPAELDRWLNVLEGVTGTTVNVIYEACQSGSFIDGVQEVSKAGRVVIASTGRENNAYPNPKGGAYFSDAFFTGLGQNQDLYTAFQWGSIAVAATGLWQTPWLDDNGDGLPNSATDGTVARGRGLVNYAFGGSPPVVEEILAPLSLPHEQGLLQARIEDDLSLARVWVTVYPPSFVEPPPSSDGILPELNVPQVALSDSNGDGVYSGVLENFSEKGMYRLLVYAEDGEGNLSKPGVLMVDTSGHAVYLPVVIK